MAASRGARMAETEVDTFGTRTTTNNNRAAATTTTTGNDLGGMMGANVADTVSNLLNMYLKMMEELVHSPDFETLVTPGYSPPKLTKPNLTLTKPNLLNHLFEFH